MATQLQPPHPELVPEEQEELHSADLHSSDLHSEDRHAENHETAADSEPATPL